MNSHPCLTQLKPYSREETMSVGDHSRYAMQMNRYFLIPIGIWPLGSDANFVLRFLQKFAIITCYLLICFLLVPCALHTFLEEPNPAIKLKLIGPMSFNIITIAKYCSLVSIIKEIGECFQHVEEDWKLYKEKRATTELSVMQSKAKVGNFLTLLSAVFMYGGGFFYHIIMPLTSGRIATTTFLERLAELEMDNSTNLDIQAHAPRPLTYPIYKPLMNVESSPWYEIVFLTQYLSGIVSHSITVGSCSLAACFVVHVCAELEIIMRLLGDYVRENDTENYNSKIKEIVDKHNRVLSFAKKVENNLNVLCFVDFIGSTSNICFVGYFFITEWESRNTISTMTYSVLLISFTFNIFIFCYIGELLTEQCIKVGEISYEIDWYRLPSKKALDIIMIIVISNCYPARITAGKMVYLSMSSFSNVIKTATSYLNLLRAVML